MDKVREVAKKLAQFDGHKIEELIAEHEIAYLERATAIAEFLKDNWQPIETAPEDGTRILASDGQCTEVIFWADGWFNQSAEISMWRVFPPTNWQPLPNPPKKK